MDSRTAAYSPIAARYGYLKNGTVNEAQFYSAGSPIQPRYRYVFNGGDYDALNRLKAGTYSYWNGGGWSASNAYLLTGIAYDAAGNLTALQRYNDQQVRIDNLTYGYASGTNRLASVTDAVTGNAETWDARSGNFTYDANGNLLTAPAPYALSTVTYDYQNLPLSLTRSGVTTTYRYNEAGQRIAKQVGSGNREMYLLDGALDLGVVTVDGSNTLVSWYWNLLAGDKVVGRQPSSGDRLYYHTDLLGSTRAVVDASTQAVVESYDYDPWGVLMPGRTLGSGTKEGFTGKEQDAETGLHYFGARYDMSALARWASADPLGDQLPEWTPYNYTLNNPVASVDPTGLSSVACPEPPCRSQDDPLKNRPLPKGVNPDEVTWDRDKGWYTHDKDHRIIRPHPEDEGHWDHWDVITPRRPGQKHRQTTYPENAGKLRPGQLVPRPGQSLVDPWPIQQAMDDASSRWRDLWTRWREELNPLNWHLPSFSLPAWPPVQRGLPLIPPPSLPGVPPLSPALPAPALPPLIPPPPPWLIP